MVWERGREQILSFKSGSSRYGNAGESEFFPLRAVPYGLDVTFTRSGDLP